MPDHLHGAMDNLTAITVTLPGGYQDEEGRLHRQVALRPITGYEEDMLASRIGMTNVPDLVTHLLAACVLRIGSIVSVTPDIIRDLLTADREYLLLKVRQITLGDQVQAVFACPECHQKMDLDFSLDEVPFQGRASDDTSHRFELSSQAAVIDDQGRSHREIEFRLPSGGDQEFLAGLSDEDEDKLSEILLARCLLRVGDQCQIDQTIVARLGNTARAEIEERMEAVAPQVEWEMDVNCPECGYSFVYLFDFATFFLTEMRIHRDLFYREVHWLALYYKWSEREIFTLTRCKRRMYINLISSEMKQFETITGHEVWHPI